MKKELVLVLLLTILLAGCGSALPTVPVATTQEPSSTLVVTASNLSSSTETPSLPSPTSDPCATKAIEPVVQKVHSHMREFDDASQLATYSARDQLKDSIADLQRIRREAEDEEIPGCLADLKKYEVDHMNTVIDTLVAFMGGSSPDTLQQGITLARNQHDQYTLELARLLGLTVVPATPPALLPSETPTP
jgi:PBP1b-binding outer membrane lipoprotein LpoB